MRRVKNPNETIADSVGDYVEGVLEDSKMAGAVKTTPIKMERKYQDDGIEFIIKVYFA